MLGPGKYDDICSSVRKTTDAQGVVLIVHGGKYGHGFSAQLPPSLLATLPDTLRMVADQIEADHRRGTSL